MANLEDEERFLRAIRAIYIPVPKALKHFFVLKQPLATLTQDLLKKQDEVHHYPNVNKSNLHLLFPGSGKQVNVKDFDMTLLLTLLRNFTKIPAPVTGWDKYPNGSDSSEGADLVRVRLIRNQLAHKDDGQLQLQEFESVWREIENVVRRLGAGYFDAELNESKISPIDQTLKNYIKEQIQTLSEQDRKILEQDRRIGELEKSVHQQNIKLKNQEYRLLKIENDTIPENKRHDMRRQIQNWNSDSAFFVKTQFYMNLLQALREGNFVTVLGNPGSGKSATIHQVAFCFQEEGFDVLPVNTPTDIMNYHNPKSHQLYIVDDALGEFSVQFDLCSEWGSKKFVSWAERWNILSRIEKNNVIDQNSHNFCKCKIVASLRLSIANTDRFKKLPFVQSRIIDIQDKNNSLTYDERIDILQTYTSMRYKKEDLSKRIVLLHDGFPLHCRMFSSNASFKINPENFLERPYEAFSNELGNLYNSNRAQYYTLVCCAMMGGIRLHSEKQEELQQLKGILNSFTIKGITVDEVYVALLELSNVYIHGIGDKFKLAHSTMRDMIAYNFCRSTCTERDAFQIFAEYAPCSLFYERVRPNGKLECDDLNDRYLLFLSDGEKKNYIRRLCRDISQFHWIEVFKNPCFPDTELEKEIYDHFPSRELTKIFQQTANYAQTMEKEFCDDVSQLRGHILGKLPFTYWLIGFGWFDLFMHSLNRSGYFFRRRLKRTGESCKLLSIFSGNIRMVKYVNESLGLTNNSCIICGQINHFKEVQHQPNCTLQRIPHLFFACALGCRDITDYCLKRSKIDINEEIDISHFDSVFRYYSYARPLTIACCFGHKGNVELLINNGGDINTDITTTENSPLHMASESGHLEIVSLLLNHGAMVNKMDDNERTPLWRACSSGHAAILKKLLSYQGLVNKCDKYGCSPLYAASKNGHFNVISLLLENKASVNCRNNFNWSPLYVASINGHDETVSLLLREDAVDIRERYGDPLLYTVCYEGYEKVVELLLLHEFQANIKNENDRTPLHAACLTDNIRVVEKLINFEADVNTPDERGRTPLHEASIRGSIKIINFLLSNGADDCVCDKWGWNPLAVACVHGNEKAVETFMEHSSFDSHRCALTNGSEKWQNSSVSPLWLASSYGQEKVVSILLKYDVNINAADGSGKTCLWIACCNGYYNVVDMLLAKGADVNARDNEGKTPIWKASANGHILIVERLVEFKAYIDTCDAYGKSPLWIASENGHDKIVSILLDQNASTSTADNEEMTSLWRASNNGYYKIVKLLLIHTGKTNINKCDKTGKTPLHISSSKGYADIVSLLLENDADVEKSDVNGETPLMVSSAAGHESVVRLLLENNAEISVKDNEGMTALAKASKNGHQNVVSVLLSNANYSEDELEFSISVARTNQHKKVVRVLLSYKNKCFNCRGHT